MKGHEILVSSDVKEYYAVSPENRKSLTVIEIVNASSDYPIPPMVIIQGQNIMVT
jgi:hypothetical protein